MNEPYLFQSQLMAEAEPRRSPKWRSQRTSWGPTCRTAPWESWLCLCWRRPANSLGSQPQGPRSRTWWTPWPPAWAPDWSHRNLSVPLEICPESQFSCQTLITDAKSLYVLASVGSSTVFNEALAFNSRLWLSLLNMALPQHALKRLERENRELKDTNKSTVNMAPPCWSFTPINKPPPSAVVVITRCIVSNTSSISSCSCSREEGVSFHNKTAAYLHSRLQSEECSCRGQAHAGQPLHWSRKSSSHTQLWPEHLRQIMTGWDSAGKFVFTPGKQELILSLAVVTVLYSLYMLGCFFKSIKSISWLFWHCCTGSLYCCQCLFFQVVSVCPTSLILWSVCFKHQQHWE